MLVHINYRRIQYARKDVRLARRRRRHKAVLRRFIFFCAHADHARARARTYARTRGGRTNRLAAGQRRHVTTRLYCTRTVIDTVELSSDNGLWSLWTGKTV